MPIVAHACPKDDPGPVSGRAWFTGLAATAVPVRVKHVSAEEVSGSLRSLVIPDLQGAGATVSAAPDGRELGDR
jgi:hypothetical protein